MITEEGLKRKTQEALGLPVEFSICLEPLSSETLSADERKILALQKHPVRRGNWLRGRGALKSLLHRMGRSEDTAPISLPSRTFSLTHSRGVAIAAAVFDETVGGVGIDFEVHRSVRPEMARFFLNDEEREALKASTDPLEKLLLRLWTVKEAVFKADPWNAERRLKSYRIWNPLQLVGTAESGGDAFQYISTELEEGFFSVACHRTEDVV